VKIISGGTRRDLRLAFALWFFRSTRPGNREKERAFLKGFDGMGRPSTFDPFDERSNTISLSGRQRFLPGFDAGEGHRTVRRTRILRIVTRLNTGGPVKHLTALARALDPGRYEQRLAAGREGPGEGSMRPFVEAQGVQLTMVPEMVGTTRLGPGDVVAVARIRRLIRDFQPDVVETHTTKAGIVGRLAAHLEGSPVVLHVYHGHVLEGYYGAIKTWMARSAERVLARKSDRLVAVSAHVKSDLVKFGVASPEQITLVEPGFDLTPMLRCRLERGALRRELGLDPGTPLVGIVGRLTPIKNHRLFLAAAAAVLAVRPDVHFLVVGDGESGPAIRALARRLGLMKRLTFTGWRYDLPRIYADLDVVVSCSKNEGTPFTIIEAMAAGCPVVATRVGGVPDLLKDQATGLLVPPAQAAPLVAAILRLLGEPGLGQALARAAAAQVEVRFDPARLAADMDGLYTELLHSYDTAQSIVRSPRHVARTSAPHATGADQATPR
jgi:glycosyltransferase involved in cell wall biosynthesis